MAKEPRSCPCKFLSTSLSSFTAAEYGDIHSLSKIKDVTTRIDDAGYSPLHFTAQFNHVAATALLLQLGCPVDGGGFCGATPLHRAAFSGATAAMKVLLEWKAPSNDYSSTSIESEGEVSNDKSGEQFCDLLARDTSFGDESTPLHKAVAGGRYLAVHMIVEALKDRDNTLANGSKIIIGSSNSWLQRGLVAEDKYGRTPLDVAQHFFQIQDTERDAVARWDEVAGGVADWGKCVSLLESATAVGRSEMRPNEPSPANKQIGNQSRSCQSIPGLPLHLRRGVMACLDCSPMPGGNGPVCMTTNWQISFQQALGNSAMQCMIASAPAATVDSGVVQPTSFLSRDKSSPNTNQDTRPTIANPKMKGTTTQSICKRCLKPTVAFYPLPGVGTLVCKSCKRLAK